MSKAIQEFFPQTAGLSVKKVRLGLVSCIYSGGTPDKSNPSYWEQGEVPWIGSGEVNQFYITEPTNFITPQAVQNSSTKLMPKGSLIIALAGQGKTKAMVAQMGIDAYGNQSLACISNYQGESRFLLWWLSSLYKEIRGLSSQDTRDGLNQSMIGQLPVPLYNLPTQRGIADFLDRETARIDALITKKQRLIELVEEREKAMLSNFMGDYLSPPDGWTIRPLRSVCDIFGRIGFRGYTTQDIVDEGEGAITLSPSNILNYELTLSNKSYISWAKYYESPEIKIFDNDILFVKTGSTIGKTSIVKNLSEAATINPQLVVLKNHRIKSEFLYLYMRSKSFQYEVSFNKFGGSTPAMSQSHLGRLKVAFPTNEDEQDLVVKKIESVLFSGKTLKKKLFSSIDRLKEFRAALITAAVTGQIDVSTWQRRGATDARLDAIEAEMSGEA